MMAPFERALTIGDFASAAGVNVETIRFYSRRGLIDEPPRDYEKIRRYSDADVARVRFVKSAQGLGFTFDEIARLLRLEDGTHCDEARRVAEEKLAMVRAHLAELKGVEVVLTALIRQCAATKGNTCCPLIDALQDSPTRP